MGSYNYNMNAGGVDYTYKSESGGQKKSSRTVYSTKLINKLLEDHNNGYEIPYDAFFNRDLELRAKGIVFEMTPEEVEEYNKCYDDPLYYISTYCKFQTDNDYQLVELRDFQKKVINIVTEETWIPSLDDFGPKNRNIIWMAARQSGKCCFYNSLISIQEDAKNSTLPGSNPKKISIGNKYDELFNKTFSDISNINYKKRSLKTRLLSKVKSILYRIYEKL